MICPFGGCLSRRLEDQVLKCYTKSIFPVLGTPCRTPAPARAPPPLSLLSPWWQRCACLVGGRGLYSKVPEPQTATHPPLSIAVPQATHCQQWACPPLPWSSVPPRHPVGTEPAAEWEPLPVSGAQEAPPDAYQGWTDGWPPGRAWKDVDPSAVAGNLQVTPGTCSSRSAWGCAPAREERLGLVAHLLRLPGAQQSGDKTPVNLRRLNRGRSGPPWAGPGVLRSLTEGRGCSRGLSISGVHL